MVSVSSNPGKLHFDILDLFDASQSCWGSFNISSGLGLRIVKELDL